MVIFFYGLVGIILLFLIITYAVQIGIDTSKQVKGLRSEVKEIKMKLNEVENRSK